MCVFIVFTLLSIQSSCVRLPFVDNSVALSQERERRRKKRVLSQFVCGRFAQRGLIYNGRTVAYEGNETSQDFSLSAGERQLFPPNDRSPLACGRVLACRSTAFYSTGIARAFLPFRAISTNLHRLVYFQRSWSTFSKNFARGTWLGPMETMSNRVDRWLLERLLKLMEEEETSSK